VICVAIGIIKGLFDGFIKQVFALAGLIAAIFGADELAMTLQSLSVTIKMIPEHWVYLICYIFSFLLILTLVSLIGCLIRKIWKLTPFGCLDHVAGGVLGFIIPVVFLSLIFNLFVTLNKQIPVIKEESRKESIFFEKIASVVPSLYPYVKERFEQELKKKELKDEESIKELQSKEMII
jgi:membrane protein required for colicin V production